MPNPPANPRIYPWEATLPHQPTDLSVGGTPPHQPMDLSVGGTPPHQPMDLSVGGTPPPYPMDGFSPGKCAAPSQNGLSLKANPEPRWL